MAKKFLEIAFAFPLGSPQEVFIEGILSYAAEHQRQWSYMLAPESNSISISQLVGWHGDGVIAALNSSAEARCAKRFHLPVVNISSALPKSPVPRAMVDNVTIGELAAEHFLERGYENLAFFGLEDTEYSKQRFGAFANQLAEHGLEPVSYLAAPTFVIRGTGWLREHKALTAWLRKLPKPVGVFATSDARARQLMNSCQQLGVEVPEQVAVLGVDDQQIICEHYHPTISSIARDSVKEGYEAARILDRLLRGQMAKEEDVVVPPVGLVARESTDAVAVQDDRLQSVLRFLRANIEQPITVAEVCRHIDVSRRWLEYAFQEMLGESPFHYIRRRRLLHAKSLLSAEKRTSINTIATRCGYTSSNQLAKAFRAEFGESPRDFRRRLSSG